VLGGLAAAAAITAVVAGITGAWSPCGFSMVDTIGSALGDARRGATLVASATFALGTLLGGALTFGSLALLGSLVGGEVAGLREGLGAALALAAAIADWRGVRIAPQIRRQVPERWRWTMPLPLACALYGVLLGLGFTTFVLAFAVWALAGISFASGDPLLGVLVGVAFGAGRALPVLWMAPGLRRGAGAGRLDEMAVEPRLWLGLRRLDALGLGLCALALAGASAQAAPAHGAGVAPAAAVASSGAAAPAAGMRIPQATDPSAVGSALVWQQPGAGGLLSVGGAAPVALPGAHPALGGATIAWASATEVTVAELASLRPRLVLAASGVNALAVSDGWLVYRDQVAQGAENLIGISLANPAQRRYLAGSRLPAQIGRPSLEGSRVVFARNTPRRSAIELVDLASGHRRTVRAASRDAAFFNPALLGGGLLFERATRCVQQLLLVPLAGSAVAASASAANGPRAARRGRGGSQGRVLLSLPSTASRDPGYQVGYTHAYNSASGCPNRRPGRGGATTLGATALGVSSAYVTRLGPTAGNAEVVTVKR
jgi:hypothetical protein